MKPARNINGNIVLGETTETYNKMPYCNEDAIYNEIALLNKKLQTLQNEIAILRKQILALKKSNLTEQQQAQKLADERKPLGPPPKRYVRKDHKSDARI